MEGVAAGLRRVRRPSMAACTGGCEIVGGWRLGGDIFFCTIWRRAVSFLLSCSGAC